MAEKLSPEELEAWRMRHGILHDLILCDHEGCVALATDCEFDESGYVCGPRLREYGHADGAKRKLEERVERLDQLLRQAQEVQRRFEAGTASWMDAAAAWSRYHGERENIEFTLKISGRKLAEALGARPSDADDSPCKRLIDAINAVVEHPEEGEY